MTMLLGSCATSKMLSEPDRTGFYVQCIMAQNSVTYCQCIEQKAIKISGVTKIDNDDDIKALVQAVNEAINNQSCEVPAGK